MKKIIAAFILLNLFGTLLYAEEKKEPRYYDIEMIFFRHLGPIDPNEQWPVGYFPANIEKALELHWEKSQDGFIGLPKEAYQLNKEANHLKYSKRYQLLQHLAWRQPGLPAKQAIAIHIRAGKPLSSRPTIQPDVLDKSTPSTTVNRLIYPLEGTVTVVLKRYLHLYTDLSFTQQKRVSTAEPLNGSAQTARVYFQSYPIQGHRKMRSKEVHYLDNPRIGIVVLMTPVKMVKKP
ncbi:MAG: CsiV family protein [Gammaproteobacteria bacterium]|nr:CsiV family protein [Gammaproteobacteria bacterium]